MPILKNPKQERFCQDYIKNGENASDAYRNSGYKAKTVYAIKANACRLLTKADIKARVDELRAEIEAKELITKSELISEINEGMEMAKSTNQLASFMKGVELKGKMIGAFIDKQEHTGDGGGDIRHKLEIEFIEG